MPKLTWEVEDADTFRMGLVGTLEGVAQTLEKRCSL